MERAIIKPSELKPGQKLKQAGPLFKKLEERVVEEERARLGKEIEIGCQPDIRFL
jgi:hypothetical protein